MRYHTVPFRQCQISRDYLCMSRNMRPRIREHNSDGFAVRRQHLGHCMNAPRGHVTSYRLISPGNHVQALARAHIDLASTASRPAHALLRSAARREETARRIIKLVPEGAERRITACGNQSRARGPAVEGASKGRGSLPRFSSVSERSLARSRLLGVLAGQARRRQSAWRRRERLRALDPLRGEPAAAVCRPRDSASLGASSERRGRASWADGARAAACSGVRTAG